MFETVRRPEYWIKCPWAAQFHGHHVTNRGPSSLDRLEGYSTGHCAGENVGGCAAVHQRLSKYKIGGCFKFREVTRLKGLLRDRSILREVKTCFLRAQLSIGGMS